MNELSQQIYGEHLEPQLPIDAAFLNRYSDVIEGDVRKAGDIILGTRNQPIVKSFVDRSGMYRDEETGCIRFDGKGSIGCRDIDILKNALLMAGRREDSFRATIDDLRTQYAGLFYYHLRLLELEGEDRVCEGLNLMREMNECERYPVRIYQDREMMDTLLDFAEDFRDVRKVFNFMSNNKYKDGKGIERMVCEPDEVMFNMWLKKCKNARHYKKIHQTVMYTGADFEVHPEIWFFTCKEPGDFEYFIAQVIEGNIDYKITVSNLLKWFDSIETYQQLSVFMECLIQLDVEPDARLFSLIAQLDKLTDSGGIGVEEFREKLRALYTAQDTMTRISSPAMTRMYELAARL